MSAGISDSTKSKANHEKLLGAEPEFLLNHNFENLKNILKKYGENFKKNIAKTSEKYYGILSRSY